MTSSRYRRSGGHVALWIVGLLTLALGLVALGLGVYYFGSAATTPSAEFFADPTGTMDRARDHAFLGVGLFSVGGFVAPIGGLLSLIAAIVELHWRTDRVRSRAA